MPHCIACDSIYGYTLISLLMNYLGKNTSETVYNGILIRNSLSYIEGKYENRWGMKYCQW